MHTKNPIYHIWFNCCLLDSPKVTFMINLIGISDSLCHVLIREWSVGSDSLIYEMTDTGVNLHETIKEFD